jgi:hypothetical protein
MLQKSVSLRIRVISLYLTEDQLKNFEVVLNKFDKHFVARRNIIFEHA